MNAALFVGSTYEKSEELWLNIEMSTVLTPKKLKLEDVVSFLVSEGIITAIKSLNPNPIETEKRL